MTDPNSNPNPNPNPGADPNINSNPSPPQNWWGGIDFGEAKDTAATVLGGYKTPQEMVNALDWRKAMSGGDEKSLKTFERYASLSDVGKAYREAQAKISAGDFLRPPPANATPEQLTEYRKTIGVPEKPEGYFEKLPNGLVIGEDDKPLFDKFATAMHSMNTPPQVMHTAVKWYYDLQNEQIEAQKSIDSQAKPNLEAKLKEAWGGDFGINANIYRNFIDSVPKEVKSTLTQARDAEGNFILYQPEVVSWLVAQAREINPAAHIAPADGGGSIQSVQGEIDRIEKVMREKRTEYNKDIAMQDRLRKLYDARIKLGQRGAA